MNYQETLTYLYDQLPMFHRIGAAAYKADLNNNYDIKKYPERWKAFQDYTYNQIKELMTGYGKIDVLWLDGGWVRPDSTINEEVRSWGYNIPKWEQDVNIPRIAAMARKEQPGIMIVDRTVHGPYEDYRTPEQSIPDKPLPYPFESNMTLSQSWGYNFHPDFKTPQFIIHSLIDVVSRGGNFLLNVAPGPDGTIEDEAVKRLKSIGKWMDINGEAIYSTRQWEYSGEGNNIRYTISKDGKYLYVFALDWTGNKLQLKSVKTKKRLYAIFVGSGKKLKTSVSDGIFTISIPDEMKSGKDEPTGYAYVFKVTLK